MLKKLKVSQFVIIDTLDLDFERGLTIFTGETGAGKSIILGAMALILGGESTPKSIRTGYDQSAFEAVFSPPAGHPSWKFLEEHNLAQSSAGEFTIHRVMKREGVDDIRVNTTIIAPKLLQKLGALLVEIHGQFANQSLLGPENQLNLLDLSGNFPQEYFDNVANALDNVHRYTKELEEEKIFLARHKGLNGKQVQSVYKRFESVGMREGFIEETKAEYAVLRTAKETMEAFQTILGRFIATNGIVGSLGAARKTLANQKNLDAAKMQKLKTHLDNSFQEANYAVEEMGRLLPEYEIDLAPLEALKKILDTLKAIAMEAKIGFEDLNEYYRTIHTKYHRIKNGRAKLEELNNLLIQSKNDFQKHAKILTEKRIVAAEEMSKLITAEFKPLMLEKAEFIVKVEEKPEMTWTKLGFNVVTFTARMNPGMPFSPISETASGGELARMILALKVVLQRVQTTPTLVFDEVDTGIGGAAAAAVGDRIGLLAEKTQVVVITHSAQVASRGNQHLHISKRVEGDMTISSVRELSMEERVSELSRMLAGDRPTPQSDAAAQSLIDEAAKNVAARKS